MAQREHILDRRLRQHTSEQINDLFVKFFGLLKKELDEVTKSQGFLSSRFDNLVSSIDGMRESINTPKAENMKLRERVTMLESQITTMENGMESMKQYLRRDFFGNTWCTGFKRNTNSIMKDVSKNIVRLLDPAFEFQELQEEISISHRIPAPEDKFHPLLSSSLAATPVIASLVENANWRARLLLTLVFLARIASS